MNAPATHLDLLLDAVRGAAAPYPLPRKPWREMLPEVLPWATVERAEPAPPVGKGRFLTLGILDDPANQAQYPAVFDLEESGGLLIGGSGGSGKTTALRTAALAAIAGATPEEVTLFVIDCASRALVPLRDLPHVAAVATGDDIESVTRVLTLLTHELERRRALLADLSVQAENVSSYLAKGHRLARVVVLIDGFQNLAPILSSPRPMEVGPLDWYGELQRVITDGRQLGIHVVMTADRRQAVPALLMSAMGDRLVLRQTDDSGYTDFGIPTALSRGLDLPSGRALWNSHLVQIGVVSDDPSAAAQGAAIAAFAAGSGRGAIPPELRTTPPPDEVTVPLRARDDEHFSLGRTDVFGEIVEVSVRHTGLCVAGPPRSGRTTTLRQAARSLVAAGYEVWTVGLGADIGGPGRHAAGKADAAVALVEDFAALCESMPTARPYVLVVDDVDSFEDESDISDGWERIAKTETARLIGSTESRNMSGYTQSSMLQELRREPTVLLLQPENAGDVLQYTGVRPQLRPGYKLTRGRGVLLLDRQPVLVQVAVGPDDLPPPEY